LLVGGESEPVQRIAHAPGVATRLAQLEALLLVREGRTEIPLQCGQPTDRLQG